MKMGGKTNFRAWEVLMLVRKFVRKGYRSAEQRKKKDTSLQLGIDVDIHSRRQGIGL